MHTLAGLYQEGGTFPPKWKEGRKGGKEGGGGSGYFIWIYTNIIDHNSPKTRLWYFKNMHINVYVYYLT